MSPSAMTRRQLIKAGAATAISAACFPAIVTAKNRAVRKLRVLGTHVTLQEQIRIAAEQDLGIHIEFAPGGSAAVLQQASTRPESFDVYEQWSNSINVLWRSSSIQPIRLSRISRWDQVNALSKTGRLTPDAKLGAGDAPNKLLYVQPDGALGPDASDSISFLPYVHNVDSFGYDTRSIPPATAYEEESWGWLFDERHAGKVAVVNEPTIGLFDLALAAQSTGRVSFADIGNMTIAEIDALFDVLIDFRRRGHFYGVWSSVPESVAFMESGHAVIESMFSPGAASLRGRGVPVRYAAPREGYRAWHGVMCISASTDGETLDAAYDYMNWWLSGKPGAIMSRQGYYISVPEAARAHMTEHEWAYWYEGLPARTDLSGADGGVVARAGESRNGGSYENRFANVAVWNTVMDNYEHTLIRWGEFLTTQPVFAKAGR